MSGVAVFMLIYLLNGGQGEDGAFRGLMFSANEEEECKKEILALTMDPRVLAMSECTRMVLEPVQVKKK